MYSKAQHFKEHIETFEELYFEYAENNLSKINLRFIKAINKILNINTEIIYSNDLDARGGRNERLIDICIKLNADTYLSGPAAKHYMDISLFENNNINVEWMDYSNYPEYKQMYEPFEHGVSVLDLIFNMGSEAQNFLKSNLKS